MFNNAWAKRKGFLFLTLIAFLLTALIGFFLMHRLQTESVQALRHSVEKWQTSLTAMRWAVIALMALFGKSLANRLATSGIIDEYQMVELTALRWRAVTWLILLELVVGQGVLLQAVSLFIGVG